jgi:amino acid adenylation domain-containing protein
MPNAVAATSAGRSLTYRELNRRANGLAVRLKSAGVGLESPVGILIDRSVDLLVGILGILKSGGCYVPLDPAFPSFRLEQMLDDARPSAVVTEKSLRGMLPGGDWNTVCVEDCGEAMAPPVVKGQTSESLAYIIYTSGSTGKPKGVEIPHRAVVNFLISMRETPGLSADDTLLAVTTLSFDISVLELLLPLISDARVVIATRQEATDGRRISVLLDEYAVTTMQATPATWQMLLDSGWNGKHDLRVFCGGEMLGRELAEELLPRTRAVWNLYGPTETTIWSTVDKVSAGGGTVSIGRPIANTTVYILDGNHRALPPGFTGNLYIGGDGLARGYHGLPELTAEQFLEVALPNGRRELLYHTGDMARFKTDGKIDFLGRNDSQVKLRGYRIELEDIETHLMSHAYVKQAVVIKRDDLHSEALVAYIILRDGCEGIVSGLRSFMLERMPEYMRPSAYVILDEYPLTPNKKIDRRRLPAPNLQRSDLQAAYMPPRTPSEKILIDILNSAFKSDKVGIHDNFFDLGGDSLLAVQILTEVSQVFNRRLPVDVFLQNPTVVNLAGYLDTPAGIVEAGDGDNLLATGGYSNEELDSDYLTVTITDRDSDGDADLPKVDAVALAYIPDGFLALTGLSKEDIVHNWLRGEPYLSNIYQTSFGSIGLIMLPKLGTELYKDQDVLADQVVSAMEMAAGVGAARVSLTGLIPSATDYGRKVADWMSKCRECPEVTTGHATTTATIIRSVKGLLEDTGRDFTEERVAIVGLGSIGYASLQLMLEVLPHPRELILCDLYQKSEVLEEIRREVVDSVGFRGRIRLETSRGRLPDAVYSASFVLGATNVPGILDVRRLQPGTLIVDDSFPPCFRVFDAINRLETDHDILFTTGGLVRLNEEIEETIYLPSGTASLLEELGGNQLLALAGRDSREITGCILSSLISGSRPEIKCTLGTVTLEDSLAHYRFLQSSGFEAARPQCENYFISPKAVARFNEVKASEAARTSSV